MVRLLCDYWLVCLMRALRVALEQQWCFSLYRNFWTLRILRHIFSSTGTFWPDIALRPLAQDAYGVSFTCTMNLETSTRTVRVQNFTDAFGLIFLWTGLWKLEVFFTILFGIKYKSLCCFCNFQTFFEHSGIIVMHLWFSETLPIWHIYFYFICI